MLLQWLKDSIWWYFSKEAACYRTMRGISKDLSIRKMDPWWRIHRILNKTGWHYKDTKIDNVGGISRITFKSPIVINLNRAGSSLDIPYLLESGLGVEIENNELMYKIPNVYSSLRANATFAEDCDAEKL